MGVGYQDLIGHDSHSRLPETKMFKDVTARLSATLKADKTSSLPASVMVHVGGRQADKKQESMFTGNRVNALELARSVVPVVKGDEAKQMADKVMVRGDVLYSIVN